MGLEDEAYAPVAEIGQGPRGQREHICPVYGEAALIRREKGSQNLQQGGFSGPGGAHDGHHLSRFHREIYAFKDLQRAERFMDILGFDNHFH